MNSTAIVLLNWRSAKDTVKCVESLIAAEIRQCDIIIVDNDSQDESINVIKEHFTDVRVIESGKNGGFAYGCNVGIRAALSSGYNYVWLLNNDTIVDKTTLPNMIEEIKRNKKAIVGSIIRDIEFPWSVQAVGGGTINFLTGTGRHIKTFDDVDKLDYLLGASILVSREALESIGLLNEDFFMYWEDTEFCIRARRKGYFLKVAKQSNVYHKEGGSVNKESYAQTRMIFRSMRKFFLKGSPFPLLPIAIRQLGKTFVSLLRREFRRIPYIWL